MSLKLELVTNEDLVLYKKDMQEAFQRGAEEGGFPMDMCEVILPEGDINRSLARENVIAYKAVLDGAMVGGAIVVLDYASHKGELDFLYVKHGVQSRGIGRFIWFEIEKKHPEIEVWETCTPYFEKRNIHFYVNVCGFCITEYWNDHFKGRGMFHDESEDDHEPNGSDDGDGMFAFRKEVKRKPRAAHDSACGVMGEIDF